jgi:integrase
VYNRFITVKRTPNGHGTKEPKQGGNMARTKRSAKLDTWNARKKLDIGKRHQEPIAPGKVICYRRPKNGGAGSWYARWTDSEANSEARKEYMERLGIADDYEDANGKTVLTYAQAQAQAVKWYELKEREAQTAQDGEPIPSGPFTVENALEAYFLDGAKRGMKGISKAKNSAAAWMLTPIKLAGGAERAALGGIQVAKLTRARIETWLDDVANSPKRKRTRIGQPQAFAQPPQTDDEKRARKDTANRIMAILKAALNFAIDQNKAQSHDKPWRDVKAFRGASKARVRFLQPDEAARLVNVCPPDFRDLVRGALLTGCRYSELARLRCKDYNSQTKIPTIFVAESKSGKPRHVNLTHEGVALFDELTAQRQSPDDLIFTRRIVERQGRDAQSKQYSGAGNEYRVGGWGDDHQQKPMKLACEAAGLEFLSFHQLRHTYASALINNGCPLLIVASQLGHSDTRMVELHYGHLAANAKQAALLAAMPTFGIVDTAPSKVQKMKIRGA